jgi:hypothetical protein
MASLELESPHFSVILYGKKVLEVTRTAGECVSTYKAMIDGRYQVIHKNDLIREHYLNHSQLPSWIRKRFEGKFGEDDTITQKHKNN